MTGMEIATVKQGLSLAATTTASIIEVYRTSHTLSKRDLQLLRIHAEKTIALARVQAISDISREVLIELVSISRMIETMDSSMLPYAISILETAHQKMRRVIDAF